MLNAARELARSFRWFARQPGLAGAGVVLLTLGIGANTTIFTLVNHLFFSPPPGIRAPEEVVRLNRFSRERPAEWWSHPDYAFFRERVETLSGLAAYYPAPMVVTATAEGDRVSGEALFVSDNFFEVLGVRPAAGRGLSPGSGSRPQTEAVVSPALSRRLFGGPEDAVGRGLSLNGHDFTVVGVAPPGFRGVSPVEEAPDAWVPLTVQPLLTHGSEAGWLERSEETEITWLQVLGRLAPGASEAEVRAELDLVAASLERAVTGRMAREGGGAAVQRPFQFQPNVLAELVRLSRLLMAAVLAVLFIAGANVAILLLARAAAQRREYGVRMAVGASRGRIASHLLADSLVLAVPGAVGGYALAFWSSGLAARALPYSVVGDLRPDLRVLGFTVAVAVLSALLFGALPGIQTARADIVTQLKEGHSSAGRSRLRETLVAVQAGLSFLLVAGALLFVRSLIEVRSEPLGFTDEERLLVTVDLGHHGYDDARSRSFVETALERLEALPGVERASTTLMVPFGGMWTTGVRADDGTETTASLNAVGPDYFDVMEIPLLDGRELNRGDRAGAQPVAVLNRAAVEGLWPGGRGVGATVEVGGELRTVVGVARNATYHEVGEDPMPHVYLPTLQAGRGSVTFLVATPLDPADLRRPVEEALHALDADLSFARVETLKQVVDRVAGRYRVGALLVTLFGVLALLLAAIGLYAVLSYLVVQRRRVIGIQMALGASRRRVAAAVVGRGLVLCVAGILLGLVGALLGAHLVTSFLYGVSPRDPASLAVVALILAGVAAVASYVPAARASRVDPIEALRQE